jgi:hypothetical protein
MDFASSQSASAGHGATPRGRQLSARIISFFEKDSERRGLSPLSPTKTADTKGKRHVTSVTSACGLAKQPKSQQQLDAVARAG